jgi:hypothetical protein
VSAVNAVNAVNGANATNGSAKNPGDAPLTGPVIREFQGIAIDPVSCQWRGAQSVDISAKAVGISYSAEAR